MIQEAKKTKQLAKELGALCLSFERIKFYTEAALKMEREESKTLDYLEQMVSQGVGDLLPLLVPIRRLETRFRMAIRELRTCSQSMERDVQRALKDISRLENAATQLKEFKQRVQPIEEMLAKARPIIPDAPLSRANITLALNGMASLRGRCLRLEGTISNPPPAHGGAIAGAPQQNSR